MMINYELSIKSRKTGETFNFWMPCDGGYIFLESERGGGTLGHQICEGGGFRGDTLSATPDTFEATCRRWYRAHMKNHARFE